MRRRLIVLILVSLLSLISQAQGIPDDVIPTAIDAANAAIPGLGYPTEWRWETRVNVNNSSLGCPLVGGTILPNPITVYRVTLLYGETPYVLHVSADTSRVQPCDEKFSTPATVPTPIQSAGCQAALRAANVPTYATPDVGTPNYTLTSNLTYQVVARTADSSWYQVAVGIQSDSPFWVQAANIQTSGTACATLPIVDASRPIETCYLSPSGAFANVRAIPTTEGDLVTTINGDTNHPILGRNEDSTWYLIQDGWAAFSVVELIGNCTTVPVVDPATINISPTRPVTILEVDSCEDYPPTQIQRGLATARVGEGGIPNRLRAEASTSAVIVTEIQPGRTINRVIGGPVCADGYLWWQVEFDGTIGWTAEASADGDYYLEAMPGFEVEAPIVDESVLMELDGPIRDLAYDSGGDSWQQQMAHAIM